MCVTVFTFNYRQRCILTCARNICGIYLRQFAVCNGNNFRFTKMSPRYHDRI